MLAFLLGLWIGGTVGMAVICLFRGGADSDMVQSRDENRKSL